MEDVPVLVASIPEAYDEVEKPIQAEMQEEGVAEIVVPPRPPRFVVPLSDAIIEQGNRITFECTLEEGIPKPEIIWYKDGISILNNHDYLTCYNEKTGICSLVIEETFAEDTAKFTCKAFNIAGLAETGATLTIRGK